MDINDKETPADIDQIELTIVPTDEEADSATSDKNRTRSRKS